MMRTILIIISISSALIVTVSTESTVSETITCSSDQFKCPRPEGSSKIVEKCIPKRWVCDFHADCPNAEDEKTDCPPPECEIGMFKCSSYKWNSTYCLPSHYKCDKESDCSDGSDELNCVYRTCFGDDFKCGNGLCISSTKKCDGYFDCRDRSDEVGCNRNTSCTHDQFACENGEKCIDKSYFRCNHRNDCSDGSDERNCSFPPCSKEQFRCANEFCLPLRWRCDGRGDCQDGSDEVNCTTVRCPGDKFICPKGNPDGSPKCIERSLVCNNRKDCEDSVDEGSACSSSLCSALDCEYKCVASIEGGVCTCKNGYQVANDSRTCIDKDECLDWGFCDQFCVNTNGGFQCSCSPGFKSIDDRCVANNQNAVIYFVHHTNIYRMGLKGEDRQIWVNTSSGSGLDYHVKKELLIWSDLETKKVVVLNKLNRSHEITGGSGWQPVALAIDWISNNIYVCDALGQKIDIYTLDGRWHTIVVAHNLTSPADIALDPTRGLMFIADTTRVLRTTMGGLRIRNIVQDAVYRATGLTLDIITKRVFWCDNLLDYIESVNYDGKNRFHVVRGPANVPAPSRLAQFESKVYFSDGTKEGVLSVDKYKGASTLTTLYRNRSTLREPRGIKIVHSLLQPTVESPCGSNNGGCEHICVLTQETEDDVLGYSCACNIGWQLAEDRKQCNRAYEFLIFTQHKFVKGQVLDPVSKNFNDAITPVVSRSARFVGLDFDSYDEYIYYSDVLQDVIYRVRRNGTSPEIVLAAQNQGVEGLALDWASKLLYYIDSKSGELSVLSTRNVTNRKILLKNLKRPRAIVVHPNRGYLFFSEWDRPANISRSNSDGSNIIVFKNLLLGWPNGLSIDYEKDRVYWVDALLDHLQNSDLNGGDVKTINSRLIRHPFSLVVHSDFVYITDWRLDAIFRLRKEGGGDEEIITQIDDMHRLYSVKVFSRQNQKLERTHPCSINNGDCEKFCFPVPVKAKNKDSESGGIEAKCECPQGEKLDKDGKSCISDPNATPIKVCTNSWHFTCANDRCIPSSWLCDGDDDCLDNSDERNCTKPTCASTEIQCKSGRCIPSSFKCDSENDCGDHSDELGCANVTCEASQFTCSNKRCIPSTWKCDSENDCGDGSDEEPSICAEKTCAYFQFTCPRSGHCIPSSWLCDGDNDCFDGTDEVGCPPVSCRENQFKCSNSKSCIHEGYKCDGIADCEDGSDEQGCPELKPNECNPEKQFQCGSSRICIPKEWVCDGNADCEDKSDEGVNCNAKACSEGYFKCENGKCVNNAYLCDGSNDCGDNSDESNEKHACKKVFECDSGEWKCPNVDKCVNVSSICDKKSDCPNGADEGPACELNECNKLLCTGCIQTPSGPLCTCPRGEILNGSICTDFDECGSSLFKCSQKCVNTKGSYFCECTEGYILEDKHKCKAKNHSEAYLVISNRRSILTSDLNQRSLDRIPVQVENVVATTSDMKTGTLFWSDMKTKKIMRLDKGANDPVELITAGLDLVEGLALDWISRVIYFVDSRLHTLEVCGEDGRNRVILLNANITQPRGVVVDPTPSARFLFWTDWGENPRIERIDLDGDNRMVIVSSKLFWPNGITLDIPSRRVYFADSKLDYIEFVDYNGQNRHQVLAGSHYLLHPHSLSLFEDTVYWTDRQLNRVLSCHKFGGQNQSVVNHLISQPLSVSVSHRSLQPETPNPCRQSPCAQLCLQSKNSNGYSCKCRPGSRVDGKKCVEEDTPFLLLMKGSQVVDIPLVTQTHQSSPGHLSPIVGIENGRVLDYDKIKGDIFWIEGSGDNGTLFKYNLETSNRTSFLNPADTGLVGSPYTIAFDWLGRNLFIGNKEASNIELIRVDGKNKFRAILLTNSGGELGVGRPEVIVLDPSEGMMYWIDEGGGGVPSKLASATMDGSQSKILLKDFEKPLGLALDFEKKVLYFSTQGKIESIHVDGSNQQAFLEEPSSNPKSMNIFESRLYYMDPVYEKITKVDLNGENSKVLLSNEASLKCMTVYRKRLSSHVCQTSNGGCEQICVPSSNRGRVCKCSVGYRLNGETGCLPFKSFVVVAQSDKVRGFSLESGNEAMVPISSSDGSILSIATHVSANFIYWATFAKGNNNGIFRIRPNGTELTHVINNGIGSNGIRGLAIDYSARQLYFTNVFPHETYIEVSKMDGTYRKVLVKKIAEAPRELAVNPVKRLLYWIDLSQFPRIGKCYLDGSNWSAIVSSGVAAPKDLTIDILTHDVYWVDSNLDTIQKVNYNGGGRMVVRRNIPNPVGVSVFKDNVYWIDRNLGGVFQATKYQNTSKATTIRTNLPSLRDIQIFDINMQPEPQQNPCKDSICEQLCFALPSTSGADLDYTCDCASGQRRGSKCVELDEYVVFATRSEIRSVHVDPKNTEVPFQPITNFSNVVGIDFDYRDKKFVFTQIRPDSMIGWFDSSTPTTQGLHIIVNRTVNPEGIAYDWIHNKIYWTDSVNSSIYCMNLDGTEIVNIAHVDRPRAIALHPCQGSLYFTDWGLFGTAGRIYKATMAGSLKEAIVKTDITQPSGLAIDYDGDKLYWTDAVRESIERSDLDGKNRENLGIATIYPFAIVVFKDWIFWTDLQLKGVYRADKHTGGNMIEIVKRLDESPRDIQVFSGDRQKCELNVCGIRNGGCEGGTCHPSYNGTAECKCNDTSRLVNGGRICISKSSNITCNPNNFACANGKCISRLWACDGDNDCGADDGSDESSTYCAYHSCGPNEFRCRNGRCIFKTWQCDHEQDCGDGSDEEGCDYPKCANGEFTCANHRCISMSQVCNGVNDCKDNKTSDESISNCKNANFTCPPNHLKCENTNICLELFWLCDGDNDCGDNSDENPLHCEKRQCPPNSFRCPNHRCIPSTWFCDGDEDCENGADEPKDYCHSEGKTCYGDLYTCKNGNCIPKMYLCDGDNDCMDNSDEDESLHQCSNRKCDNSTEFYCPANKLWGRSVCINRKWVCDQDPDCADGSDESSDNNCPSPEPCQEDQWQCANGRCINMVWKCDFDNDCGDGSDEGKFCMNHYPTCSPTEFACNNFKCIRNTFRCDNEDDCGDMSDEMNCPGKNETSCLPSEFKCAGGEPKCIPKSKVCDKTGDCGDESDESLHCGINECASIEVSQCAQICVDTPTSYHCGCNTGFRLMADGKACADINECLETPGVCDQGCENRDGSFFCKCNTTYYEKTESGRCKRLDGVTPYLIFTNKYYIRNMSVDGSELFVLHQDLRNVVALDFDIREKTIYYADVTGKTIFKSKDGTEPVPVVRHESHGLEGLSVDWVGRKLYWLDRHSKSLEVSELNGTSRRTLKTHISDPRAIVLFPPKGILFFTSWHLQAYIGKIHMDGSNFSMLLNWENGIAWPNALTIDYMTERLYFADAHLDYIDFVDFDGRNRHTVVKGIHSPHVFALTLFEHHLYYTDWNLKGIVKMNKFNGSKEWEILRNTTHRPYDIHVIHPLRQIPYVNPCGLNNGGCTHLCLLSPNPDGNLNYTCACPTQFVLMQDNKTCIANCTAAQHRCGTGDEKCISKQWLCDGERDCNDSTGSDELNCPERKCRTGLYQCKNFNCTSLTTICDGIDDCGDNSDEAFCDADCGENEFKCKKSGKCILKAWTCDGDGDCSDRSDESHELCHNRTCNPSTEFTCKNSKCIPKLFFCDADDDCGDDSDEPALLCRNRNCTEGWRRCPQIGSTVGYYRCIPEWLFCDGKPDCMDAGDERAESCTKCDGQREFTCRNGRCIPNRWKCDMENDCGDNSDELPTNCPSYRGCSESEFRCGNGRCIPKRWRCDLDDDCLDGSDENACGSHVCRNGTFQCLSGHCIASHFRCDGDVDCRDLSDEMKCPPRYPDGKYCPREKFECANHLCVSHTDLCDGSDDCHDGSDEKEELCKDFSCDKVHRFQCANRKCIPKYLVCNGRDECGDRSDEDNLSLCIPKPRECTLGEFRCANKNCIEKSKICNLKDDCGDLSDELGCHEKLHCGTPHNGGCEHRCHNLTSTTGYICTCNQGFIVTRMNPKRCEDLDECQVQSLNNCTQVCRNMKGTFNCSCDEGFHPSGGFGICRAIDSTSLQIFVANGPEILGLASTRNFDLIRNEGRIEGVDYDISNKMLYYVDSYKKTIKRSLLPGYSGANIGYGQDLEIKSNGKPTAIALDNLAGNLYWSEQSRVGNGAKSKGKIMVSTSDGRYRRSIITSTLELPTSVALDPVRGLLFWTDAGTNPKIESSWMDGSKRWTMTNEEIRWPTSITIDFHNDNRLYFVDTKLGRIESMNMKGMDRLSILQGDSLRHPIALDVFESYLYFINRDSGDLLRHDKFGRGISAALERDLGNPTSLRVFHPLKYNGSAPNPCRKAGCSHLCLLIPNGGFRCACPENTNFRQGSPNSCDAPFEREKPSPEPCHCENGGVCRVGDDGLECLCPENYNGQTCGQHVERRRLDAESVSAAAYAIPIVLIILLSLGGGAFYIFLRKKDFGKGTSPAVSFRQGSNVTFNESSPSEAKVGVKGGDFSNPMFEGEAGSSSIAILPPSAVVERSSPQIQIRQFDPNAEDSGKDTQTLVNEADC